MHFKDEKMKGGVLKISNLCEDEDFDEERKYRGPIFLLSGLMVDNPIKLFTMQTNYLQGIKGKLLKMKFMEEATINGMPLDEFFKDVRIISNQFALSTKKKEHNLFFFKSVNIKLFLNFF